MFRGIEPVSSRLLCALAVLCLSWALPAEALAAPKTKPADQKSAAKPEAKRPLRQPMVFYVATGGPDACGPGCSTWIAAEGTIETGTADRLRQFLKRFPGQPPPIYFNSPGGRILESLVIGRILRQHGMTVAISATVPDACKPDDEASCRSLKERGEPLAAALRSTAICSSACAYALMGGKVRLIAPDARLGVHALRWESKNGKPITVDRLRQLTQKSGVEIRAYLREMGISARLHDVAVKIPHEKIYYLTRNEIVGLGIDTRSFVETRWFRREMPVASIWKHVHARGESRDGFPPHLMRLTCAGPYRVRFDYFRGLDKQLTYGPSSVRFVLGSLAFEMPAGGSPARLDLFIDLHETGYSFASFTTHVSYDALQEAERAGAILLEDTSGDQGAARSTRISVDELPGILGAFRDRCRHIFQ